MRNDPEDEDRDPADAHEDRELYDADQRYEDQCDRKREEARQAEQEKPKP